jgi:hypothetical protein
VAAVLDVALFPYRHPNEHKKNPPPHTWRPSALPPSANGSFSINRKLATPFSLKLNKKIFLFLIMIKPFQLLPKYEATTSYYKIVDFCIKIVEGDLPHN